MSEWVWNMDDSLQRVALCENQNLCINCSGWQVSTEKVSTISAESDIIYSERNCHCWTCHLTLQSQTNSDTNFFIRGALIMSSWTHKRKFENWLWFIIIGIHFYVSIMPAYYQILQAIAWDIVVVDALQVMKVVSIINKQELNYFPVLESEPNYIILYKY